jgi:hypothetical protein
MKNDVYPSRIADKPGMSPRDEPQVLQPTTFVGES